MSQVFRDQYCVMYAAIALFSLLFSVSAFASTTGGEFLAVYTFVNDAATGYLGRAIAICGGLIGLGVGAATGRPVAAIVGIVLAVFGALGPTIIDTIFSTATI